MSEMDSPAPAVATFDTDDTDTVQPRLNGDLSETAKLESLDQIENCHSMVGQHE